VRGSLTGSAEHSEAEAMFQLQVGAPDAVRSSLGIEGVRIGGGVAVAMTHDRTNYWNKALGFTSPVTHGLVAAVCEFYREQGSPVAVLQFAPAAMPYDWDDISLGLTPSSYWLKLGHDLTTVPARVSELRVGQVPAAEAHRWACVLLHAFGMPSEDLSGLFASLVGRSGFRCFAAWDGDSLVAAAAMFVQDGVANLIGSGTLPSHRRRGAHSVLLSLRLKEARDSGCRVVFAESGKDVPGERNVSLDNMHHLGFTVLYERQNWIWRPGVG
jgi:GNAT superfamily N-acetyltransferase